MGPLRCPSRIQGRSLEACNGIHSQHGRSNRHHHKHLLGPLADAIADFDVPNLDVVTNLWALLWAAAASTAVAVPVEIRGAVGWRANTSAFVFVPVVTLTAEVGFALAATVCRGIGVTVPVLVSWADLRFADAFAFFVVPVFTK